MLYASCLHILNVSYQTLILFLLNMPGFEFPSEGSWIHQAYVPNIYTDAGCMSIFHFVSMRVAFGAVVLEKCLPTRRLTMILLENVNDRMNSPTKSEMHKWNQTLQRYSSSTEDHSARTMFSSSVFREEWGVRGRSNCSGDSHRWPCKCQSQQPGE